MDKFLILCGADSNRFNANINHQRYADYYNVEYQFAVVEGLNNPFFIKPHCITAALEEKYTHILCIDDDVFFINNNWDFKTIFERYPQDLIVTQGRAKKSGTTLFNAGIMFIRNTANTKFLFKEVFNVSWKIMKKNWKKEWGPLVGNEQPRLIYLTQTNFPNEIKILNYPGFNANETTFREKGFLNTNPPIVHITGANKEGRIQRFINNTGIIIP